MCVDMCVGMCIDMCVDMCVDMHHVVVVRVETTLCFRLCVFIGMCTDRDINTCKHAYEHMYGHVYGRVFGHVYGHVYRQVCRRVVAVRRIHMWRDVRV